MAETASTTEDSSRGRPYYEKLRSDLKATLDRKRETDRAIAQLEESIAAREAAYLEDTSAAGNIIRGFDNYIKASSSTTATTGGGTSTRRKGGITDADRIFSRSSVTWMGKDAASANTSLPTSESGTPAGRETPVGNTKGGQNKKKRALADNDDGEDSERQTKRGKVSWVGGRE